MSLLSIIPEKCINLQRNGMTWLIPQTKANTEAAENLIIKSKYEKLNPKLKLCIA